MVSRTRLYVNFYTYIAFLHITEKGSAYCAVGTESLSIILVIIPV